MATLLLFITVMASGIFSGAAIYINAAEHPARLECRDSSQFVLKQWQISYHRAAIMQASLALLSGLFGVLSYMSFDLSFSWLLACLMIFSVIPFTLKMIMPTNNFLHKIDHKDASLFPTLEKWGKLHAVRSVVSTLAFAIFVGNLTSK